LSRNSAMRSDCSWVKCSILDIASLPLA
jgi:hypothetical protein